MIQVSIDMSTNEESYQNRIFGEVIDIQNDCLLCEYTGANFDFDNKKKMAVLEEKLRVTEKLEAGRSYYVRYSNGSIEIDTAYEWIDKRGEHFIDFCEDNNGKEKALAPVPSYEELQELKEYEKTIKSYNGMPIDYTIACETVNKLLDEKDVLKKENARLKELLKESQKFLEEENQHSFTSCFEMKYEILEKIEEALK